MSNGLEAILVGNRDRLLRFLRARGAADPEDLLQELWFKARSAPSGPVSDPLAYLYGMANNLLLDQARAAARRGRREQVWAQDVGGGVGEVSYDPSADRILLSREQLRAAEGVLAGLGDRTDAIFRRYRLDQVGQAQIAAEVGISLSAVEKHLQRAYRALAAWRDAHDAE